MEPNFILQGYSLLVLIGLPVLAARDVGRDVELERAAEFRRAIYASIALSLVVIAAATFGIAAWQGLSARELGWTVVDTGEALLWGVGAALAGLLAAWLVSTGSRALGLREGGLAFFLMPRSAREKRAFLVLAGVGAVCEEYVYRGFLLRVVADWAGSGWVGLGVTAASFGLAHGYQRLAGILRATALGALLAVPVLLTGSLFPAVVAHFWINAAIGLGGWRWLISGAEESSGEEGP